MSTYTDIVELHRQAMDKAEYAMAAKIAGEFESARNYFRSAFELERQAAELLTQKVQHEPDRAILHRSAASLALDCGEVREAERLIAIALAGDPPNEIAEELRNLLQSVYFHRHLELRGIVLDENELQLSIAGEAVGHGIAPSDAIVGRIKDVERLLFRTAERELGLEYRERGEPVPSIRSRFDLFLSLPRAASYAITLKIGRQLTLPFESKESNIIDETLECLDLYDKNNIDLLKIHIPQESYFRNFVGLARNIAPDGKNISLVGFTVERKGKPHSVALTRQREEFSTLIAGSPAEKKERTIKITGILLFADALHTHNKIKIKDSKGREYTIIVPEGMMNDIVKPLWHDEVVIQGVKRKHGIILQDIGAAKQR